MVAPQYMKYSFTKYFHLQLVLFSFFFLVSCTDNQNGKDVSEEIILENTVPYNTYTFSEDPNVINFGDQPYFMPGALIIEIIKRDKIFSEELAKLNLKIKFHHFLKGNDINYFMRKGLLDGCFSGDMPTIRLSTDIGINTVTSFRGPTSIISRDIREIKDLREKKIGYAFGSNAHYYLLNILKKNDVPLKKVELVSMNITEMEKALLENRIDAYSTWEFSPPTTTKTIQNKITTHKGKSYGFITFSKSFSEKQPEAVKIFIAAQIRAIKWLKLNNNNQKLISLWVYETIHQWGQRKLPLSIEKTKRHVHEAMSRDYLDTIPRLPQSALKNNGVIRSQFDFLKENGLVPETARWENTMTSFNVQIIDEVLANPDKYRLHSLDVSLVN